MIDEKALMAAARAMAEGLGDNYDDAFASKSDWVAERGEKGGRFRDVNEPFQPDYDAAARAAVSAYLGALEGWVLVPVEADIYMGDAGYGELDQDADCTCCAYEVYRAMIAARPQNEGETP